MAANKVYLKAVKTIVYLGIFLFAFNIISFSQNEENDLIENIAQAETDSLKCVAYYKLIAYYRKKDPDQQLKYLNDAILFANQTKNIEYLATFYAEFAQHKMVVENLDSALIKIKIAENYLPKVKNVRTNLMVLTTYSDILDKMGDVKGASEKYIEALEIAELNQDKLAVASCYTGLASLFMSQNMYDEAYIYLRKFEFSCSEFSEKVKPRCKAVAYTNIANYFVSIEKPDSTIVYALKAIELKEKFKDYTGLSISYNALAKAQVLIGDTTNALKSYEKSLAAAEVVNFKSEMLSTLLFLGNFYIKTNELEKVDIIYNKTLPLIHNISSTRVNIEYYTFVSDYFKLKKDYKGAFKALSKKHELVITNRNETNANFIAELETKYETNKISQQKEVAESKSLLAEEKAKRSRNLSWIALFSLAIVSLLILFILNRLKVIRNQKTKLDEAYLKLEESTKNELAVSNLKALKSQMNPHFIFNLLNSIQALVLKGDVDSSYTYMNKFATLVRQTLHFSDADLVELEEEIDLLKIYLELEKLRFPKDFDYQIINNDIEGIEIPPLLIQPFIENALVHGLLHKEGKKMLKIEFELKDKLICIITDNGIGRTKSKAINERQNAKHQSFSTKAIAKRFKILSEAYKGEFGFKYEDVFENEVFIATKVKLSVPFKRIF